MKKHYFIILELFQLILNICLIFFLTKYSSLLHISSSTFLHSWVCHTVNYPVLLSDGSATFYSHIKFSIKWVSQFSILILHMRVHHTAKLYIAIIFYQNTTHLLKQKVLFTFNCGSTTL